MRIHFIGRVASPATPTRTTMCALLARRAVVCVLGLARAGSTVSDRTLAQSLPADSEIRALIRPRVDSGVTAGIVVGVSQNGHRRFVAYGSAGPGRAPLDEHTLFEIGSVSKTFSGVLLADAVVRGEVNIDAPVASLLPAGTIVPSRDGRQITLDRKSTRLN